MCPRRGSRLSSTPIPVPVMNRSPLLVLLSLLAGCASDRPAEPPPVAPPGPGLAMQTELSQQLAAAARRRPLVVAHRGASGVAPENTLAAFREALGRDADLVELDFRATADGTLVCLHDATLDRTTDAAQQLGRDNVAIESLDLEALQEFDAGSWKSASFAGERIPTLDAALDTILAGAVPMIEHKAGPAEALVELLRRKGLVDRVLVQSFDWDWLARVRELEPRLTLAALGSRRLDEERLQRIEDLGVSMVHWNHQDLRLADITHLRGVDQLVCVYTVNPDLVMLGCLGAGLDAITTDHPRRLLELARR